MKSSYPIRARRDMPLIERFERRVEPLASGCWRWNGGHHGTGYAAMAVDGVMQGAHRIGYQLYRGPIPEGLVLDHLCRNRWCVNPDHLEIVTHRENLRRGAMATVIQTGYCRNGHLMDERNTRPPHGNGGPRCRTCHAGYERARRLRLKEERS